MGKLTNQQIGGIQSASGVLGTTINQLGNQSNGKVNVGSRIISGGIQGAGAGAAFGPIGIAVGAGLGALSGGVMAGINNQKIKDRMEAYDAENLRLKKQNMIDYSNNILSTFPSQGITNTMMYRKGGYLPKLASGGLMPISPSVSQAVGDNHGQDTDGDGQNGIPVNGAEVENKEIVYKDAMGREKVLSEQDGFADKARQMMSDPAYMKAEGMFENKVNNINRQLGVTNDKFQKGTLTQRLTAVSHPLDVLFNEQEQTKQQQGNAQPQGQQLPMKATGGYIDDDPNKPYNYPIIDDTIPMFGNKSVLRPNGLNVASNTLQPDKTGYSPDFKKGYKGEIDKSDEETSLIDKIAPAVSFVDNIYNSYATNQRPDVPKPILNTATQLKTNYNIVPQLEENKKQLNYLYKNIDQNIANPQVANANKVAGYVVQIKQQNTLQGQKENIETGLINQNKLNTQQVQFGNNQLENNYNTNKMIATDNKLTDRSENVANAVTKATMLMQQANLKELDKQKLAIIKAKYKSTGVLTRTDLDFIDSLGK